MWAGPALQYFPMTDKTDKTDKPPNVPLRRGWTTGACATAARELGLPVLIIARPPVENGDAVETVDAALTWVKETLS